MPNREAIARTTAEKCGAGQNWMTYTGSGYECSCGNQFPYPEEAVIATREDVGIALYCTQEPSQREQAIAALTAAIQSFLDGGE